MGYFLHKKSVNKTGADSEHKKVKNRGTNTKRYEDGLILVLHKAEKFHNSQKLTIRQITFLGCQLFLEDLLKSVRFCHLLLHLGSFYICHLKL